jgi:L-amino acid N-acyltransferase YncA
MQADWHTEFDQYAPWGDDMLRRHLGPYFLVAHDGDGTLVGYAVAGQHGNPDVPLHFAIHDLYVVPKRRGDGVGTKLLEAVLAKARAEPWPFARLTPVCHPEDMGRLELYYGKYGFRWEDPPNFMRLVLR